MKHVFYKLFSRLPEMTQNHLLRQWYVFLSRLDKDATMIFMNYGWVELNPSPPILMLDKSDEPNRFSIQLYHHVIGSIDLKGKEVLEVGCGRGGGSSYIARYFHPSKMVGVDRTSTAIQFCKSYYHLPNLTFFRNDAESLNFRNETADVVVNIESSHCYRSIPQFLKEIYRIIRPGGYFLFADFRRQKLINSLRRDILKSGFVILKEEDITANVMGALVIDNLRKQELIQQNIPRIMHKVFNEFAGMEGTLGAYSSFESGEKRYFSFIMQKP